MKNYFLKGIVTLILSTIWAMGFAGLVSADNNPSFWAKQSNGELYTNSGNGLGQSIINVAGCNGCGSGGLSSVLTDGITIFGDGLNDPLSALQSAENKIISGGIAWSGTGYVYDVSSIYYYFDGFHTSGPDQVTMAGADPTNNRFDAVVVNESGTISVITGTASANPAFPTIPETQLVIGYVLVEAGTTAPTVLQDLIYDENTGTPTEWTTSTYTTGTGATGSIDFNGTTSCYHGTKCIDLVTNQRLGARFVRGTAIDLQTFAYVQVWYRNNATVLASTKTPSVRFENSSGTPIGNTVPLTTYGISRSVVGTWQVAVIPVSAFGSVTNVKGLRAIMTGGTLASQANWSLDFMLTSGGILPNGAIGPIYLSPSGTLYSSGAATGATAVTDSIFFGTNAGFQATIANSSIFLGKNSGYGASIADNAIFIGESAGYGAVTSDKSIFIGESSGFNAIDAEQSVFLGRLSGSNATNANNSNFIGSGAGYNATNAASSVFLGYQAGYGATDALASIFIGSGAGLNDTTTQAAIAIGYQSGSGGFNQSIALGTGTTNTANNQMMIGSALFPITDIQWQGILTSSDMHNNALAQGNATAQQTRSGTYTPTLTGVTNVTTTTARKCQWMRVGNVVTVSGQMDIDPTGTGTTVVGISLPVASNFGTAYELGGAGHGAAIYADATNNRAELSYVDSIGSNDTMTFTFSYEVL